jgi:hypothetical protein
MSARLQWASALPLQPLPHVARLITVGRVSSIHLHPQHPSDWTTSAQAAHPPPSQLQASAAGAFRGRPGPGPREAREIAALRARAAVEVRAEAQAVRRTLVTGLAGGPLRGATVYADTFRAPPIEGLK